MGGRNRRNEWHPLAKASRVFVTDHAMERFRERIDKNATERIVEGMVRCACRISGWARHWLVQSGLYRPSNELGEIHYLQDGNRVYVVQQVCDLDRAWRVLTCYVATPKAIARRRAKSLDERTHDVPLEFQVPGRRKRSSKLRRGMSRRRIQKERENG